MKQNLNIKPATLEYRDGFARLSTQILIDDVSEVVWYQVKNKELINNSSPFIVASLLVAMKLGRSVQLAAPLSNQLITNLPTLQNIFKCWDKQLQSINIHADNIQETRHPNRKTAMFFSGGLDSFYTLLRHRDELDALIFVHGFDIPLDNTELREKVIDGVRRAAKTLDIQLIEIETNVKTYGLKYLKGSWGVLYHGAALVSAGLALSSLFNKIYIPATHDYANLQPWGSHPIVDPLWSTESIEFVHDGCEATRVDKAELVAQHDTALQTLRVCWRNLDGTYNCGRCEKCVRTMLNLHIVGALDKCSSFKQPLTVELIRAIHLEPDNYSARAFVQENLQALEAKRLNPEMQEALRKILRPTFLQKLEYFVRARLGLLH
jgi:hypothetical protein